jgi:hypothetical protein
MTYDMVVILWSHADTSCIDGFEDMYCIFYQYRPHYFGEHAFCLFTDITLILFGVVLNIFSFLL